MLNIYVDADSCPVKEEVIKVGSRYKLQIFIVSNKWWQKTVGHNIHRIKVDVDFDAADNWIVEHAAENDIIITSDILLADRCLKKNAFVLSPSGKHFNADNIGMKLAMRDLSSYLREMDQTSGFNPSFNKQDRSNFLQSLDNIINNLK